MVLRRRLVGLGDLCVCGFGGLLFYVLVLLIGGWFIVVIIWV